jgi:hypothetical protein
MCTETKISLVSRISAREDTARLLRTQIRM